MKVRLWKSESGIGGWEGGQEDMMNSLFVDK